MMVGVKDVIRFIAFGAALAIAIFVILKVPGTGQADTSSQISRDFVLFICSTVVSWTISAWFAKKDSSEKIDAIAERSFEKMASLTLSIEKTKKYLVDTIKLSQSDADQKDATVGLNTYKNRINGCIFTLDQMSSNNDTFRADWLGVVSIPMKIELSKKVDVLSNIPEIIAELNRAPEAGGVTATDFDQKVQEIEREVVGAGRFIAELRGSRHVKPQVADIKQQVSPGTAFSQSGTVSVNVNRQTYRATATGALQPPMNANPEVTIILVKKPESVDLKDIRYPVGVGTNFNFNIMLASSAPGISLALGEYVFEYSAVCGTPEGGGEISISE
jgi:hypothetical protein